VKKAGTGCAGIVPVGVILVNLSLGVGEFAQTGWLAYPPLSGIEYSPGVGVAADGD
jgi:heme/copper-type cytochrome/quinol oxidase subunit 1